MDLFNLKNSHISQFWEIFFTNSFADFCNLLPHLSATAPFSLSGTLTVTVWGLLGRHLVFSYLSLLFSISLALSSTFRETSLIVIFKPSSKIFHSSIIFIFISSLLFSNVPFYSILYLLYGCNIYFIPLKILMTAFLKCSPFATVCLLQAAFFHLFPFVLHISCFPHMNSDFTVCFYLKAGHWKAGGTLWVQRWGFTTVSSPAGQFHWGPPKVCIFRFIFLGWSGSPEKALLISCRSSGSCVEEKAACPKSRYSIPVCFHSSCPTLSGVCVPCGGVWGWGGSVLSTP